MAPSLKRALLLLATHLSVGFAGFSAGVYFLPILVAPEAPSASAVQSVGDAAEFTGEFRRDLADSDSLHWGEGTVYVSLDRISLAGEVAPGPAYKLYLAPEFVETEAQFKTLKPTMALVGDVKTFDNFIVNVPRSVDVRAFNTVVVWCEAFSQFITAARYQ
jgi:hypothetical protein